MTPKNSLDTAQMLALMERFRKAYAAGNREELLAVTTPEFLWRQHFASSSTDAGNSLPDGRVLVGVDALLEEVAWRSQHWSEVRYADLEEQAAQTLLVQTFTISGKEDGVSFTARAVDLYPVAGGLIAHKDTYWKYLK